MTGIQRRRVLRGLLGGGAVTVALPLLDCFLNGKSPQPTLMWSMPTQNAFFIAKDQNSGATINSIIKWWESIHYAQ